MRIRRAATLAMYFENSNVVLHNFLTNERTACSKDVVEIMSRIDDWCTPREILKVFHEIDAHSLATLVAKLVKYNILIVEGTAQDLLDKNYRHKWQWGISAGLFHFSIRDTRFMTGAPSRDFMRKRKAWRPSPKLVQENSAKKVKLPRTNIEREPFALMYRRRSRRQFDGKSISKQKLADCLFAGNGIVGFINDKDFGRLPIAMTPSGGARNPFELYVYAQHIEDLKPGFYHYDALRHNLGVVRIGAAHVPSMLGTQKWPTKAAAIVFLVANFYRSSWKYHMPMAYRVVAMEAGFIGQNIALAATHHGLSAVPSGALNDSLIEGHLGIPAVESAVLLTMSIGRPKAQAS